ncbi:MAG: aspartate--tRNA(Asn) ligase [Thaumarchaeota archaeon]|nr:aspartate--tRNA(Asn) ligase [Nitrososphaerota archaeon]
MKMAEELGNWRRTHYSTQVTPALDGQDVTVFGWVGSVRRQSGITFVMLNDKEGKIQVTLHRAEASAELVKRFESICEHMSIGVRGKVKKMAKSPSGAEIIPVDAKILSLPTLRPAFSVYGGNLPSLEKRLDIRTADLRREKAQAICSIMRTVLRAVREFLQDNGYLEVVTPKLISSATEGGASLFSVLYYNKPAFLTQSPQLYKEQLVMPFEKVFEIGPAFRAEESRTQRHLSEITSVDIEEAYVDYNDIMSTLERMLRHVLKKIGSECSDEFSRLKVNPPKPPAEFRSLTYDDVVSRLEKQGQTISWGEDITGRAIAKLAKELGSFYYITDWPSSSKPFYIKPDLKNPKVCESFDLMFGPLELASGGSRVSSKSLLVRRLKEQKLRPQAFDYHLRAFDYGMPPHAGFGLGLERLMMVLTSEENIREVTLYPRDKLRLVP